MNITDRARHCALETLGTNLHRSCRLSEQRGGEGGVTLNSDGFFQGEQISWNQWGLLHNTENALKTTELQTSNTGLKTCGSYPHRREIREAPLCWAAGMSVHAFSYGTITAFV